MYDTITLEVDSRGVATLTLARPAKHNALSGPMIEELTKAARWLDAASEVRVVVLAGAGDSFCAGGDLAWMRAQMDADADARAEAARTLARMLGAINHLSKPVIARLHGAVFGGGVGLACVCDRAIAAQNARFGLTETRLGLIPATIGPYVVARMGAGAAREVFLSSRRFDAHAALRLGVVGEVVPRDDLDGAVEAEVAAYLECAPAAVAEAKRMALALGGAPDVATIDASIAALVRRWEHDEAREGLAAFFARRAPSWRTSHHDPDSGPPAPGDQDN